LSAYCVRACKIKRFTEREFFLWPGGFCVFKTGIPGGPGTFFSFQLSAEGKQLPVSLLHKFLVDVTAILRTNVYFVYCLILLMNINTGKLYFRCNKLGGMHNPTVPVKIWQKN